METPHIWIEKGVEPGECATNIPTPQKGEAVDYLTGKILPINHERKKDHYYVSIACGGDYMTIYVPNLWQGSDANAMSLFLYRRVIELEERIRQLENKQ